MKSVMREFEETYKKNLKELERKNVSPKKNTYKTISIIVSVLFVIMICMLLCFAFRYNVIGQIAVMSFLCLSPFVYNWIDLKVNKDDYEKRKKLRMRAVDESFKMLVGKTSLKYNDKMRCISFCEEAFKKSFSYGFYFIVSKMGILALSIIVYLLNMFVGTIKTYDSGRLIISVVILVSLQNLVSSDSITKKIFGYPYMYRLVTEEYKEYVMAGKLKEKLNASLAN